MKIARPFLFAALTFSCISPVSADFRVLRSPTTAEGKTPFSPLVPGPNGRFYGTFTSGGANGNGTFYRIEQDGSAFKALFSFPGNLKAGPPPIFSRNQHFYGTARAENSNGAEPIYKINTDGTGFKLLAFLDNGLQVQGQLLEATNGSLYGVAVNSSGRSIVFRINRDGSGFRTLHTSFEGDREGFDPTGPLIQVSNGKIYGVNRQGGNNNGGTVWRMDQNGSHYSVVRDLPFVQGEDVGGPSALIEATDNRLYGTNAGRISSNGTDGFIFRLKKDGSAYKEVRFFTKPEEQGNNPSTGVIEGSDGKLYGTTARGGNTDNGVLFSVNMDGTGFKKLVDFGGDRGAVPGAVIEARPLVFLGTCRTKGEISTGTIWRFKR